MSDLREIEDIIRINVDYISNKNGISFDGSQYLPKALSEQILKYIVSIDGIMYQRCEPIDEPKETYRCTKCGRKFDKPNVPHICNSSMRKRKQSFEKCETKEKTLEEKIQNAHRMPFIAETYAQIAKEHYQEHPEEICTHVSIWKKQYDELWKEWKKVEKNYQGMVSIDKVLEVFDEAKKSLVMIGYNTEISFIRKALEQLKEKE